ncbi:MAG TPA: MFS transporter [Caldilineaceae bacterium]|nr:MFS transporter [Caldilineaceae bacterium]
MTSTQPGAHPGREGSAPRDPVSRPPAETPPSGLARGRLVVFLLFTAAYFLSYFYRSANAVIAPDLAAGLALSAGQLGLMTSLFFAAFAAVQIPLGVWLDRWGPRWVTPALMWVAVAGSLLFALAPGFGLLALGRALIGVGMAGVLMGSLKIFSQWFPVERFATVAGLLIGIGALGALAAATPMAWLNAAIGWRAVFWLGAGATALVATSILLWTRNTPPGIPWTGGRDDSGSAALVFRDLRFWRMAPIAFFLAGVLMGFQGLWAGPYLFDVVGLDDVQAGNVLLWMGIGLAVGFVCSGWLADRFGLARIVVGMSFVFALCQFALAARPDLLWVRLIYALFGFTGAANTMTLAQARQSFPLSMTGKAVTAVNLFAIGGTFLLQWWMGLIIGAFPMDGAGHYPPQAYTAALLFTGVGTGLALLWYLPLALGASLQEAPPSYELPGRLGQD